VRNKLYKTVAFTAAFVCTGTELRLLGEEKAWIVLENDVLGRIFGPKTEEVTADWGITHNEKLQNLYSSSNVTR
jgi:hypothetical protein